MKYLLILVAASGFFVCQAQAHEEERSNSFSSTNPGFQAFQKTFGSLGNPHIGLLRDSVTGKIIAKIRETAQGIISGLRSLTDILDSFGLANVSTLLRNFMDALSQFVKNVGTARISGEPRYLPFSIRCQPYDMRPQCQNGFDNY